MSEGMLSVIVPVTERFDDPVELFEAYDQALSVLGRDYEFIYVLDGAYRDTRAALLALQEAGRPLRVLQLSKSFGEATALTAGFESARGDLLMTLPAYHQVEPEAIGKLLDALPGQDMVVVRRWPRRDSRLSRLQTRAFSALLGLFLGGRFHDLGCSVRLFRRAITQEVPLYGDQHRFLPVLAERQGFRVSEIDLPQSSRDRYRRIYSPGVYPRRLLDLLTVFFLIKFTKKPLRFFGLIGASTAAIGALALVVLVFERLVLGESLADRPALLLSSLLVVLGVQVFGLGLLGELIIFTHAKDLKEYTVREIVGGDSAASAEAARTGVAAGVGEGFDRAAPGDR